MGSSEIEAARVLLSRLGITPEQLTRLSQPARDMPTVDQYIAKVAAAVPDGTRKVYGTYWRRIAAVWGTRRLDEPTPLEIQRLVEQTKCHAVVRRNSRGGRTAAEHLVGALRCLYSHAVADGLVGASENPAARVPKPRRLASNRRAVSAANLAEILRVASSTGNDPELDSLILRFHTETACRRGGALSLERGDLDAEQCVVRLREKGGTSRWQPVSPTLMNWLISHGEERGAGDGRILRYRDGRPLTSRRYDYLWKRLGEHIPWVATQQVTSHWLRHTTLTWVERTYGYSVARAFAGHEGRRDDGVTSTYVRADLPEVARALAGLTGEPHPLAELDHSPTPAMPPSPLTYRPAEHI